ncbi:nucleotidyltransferase family protein [Paenibacillus sp.]|uniref:nucleotidyltransferase family protein n=1 Tax=Paenibacillus sp. TaxID=58172 RepID=UPI002D255D7F|nr:nucleotidyltransferase family protein [Paenibacillus sp.]HZG87833.1 nucleotidyltransferase family protein [Paenibacillus sp.]
MQKTLGERSKINLVRADSVMLEEKLIEIMLMNPRSVRDLEAVKSLKLKNWFIAAGYVRNQVWDYLHNNKETLIFEDVDIIYYEASDITEGTDKKYEEQLRAINSNLNWSVKNQARMHFRNNHEPYLSLDDAMKRWPETDTAVGIKLTDQGRIEVIAPHGLEDLFELKLRQSKYCDDRSIFMKRIYDKKWLDRWKQLKIV